MAKAISSVVPPHVGDKRPDPPKHPGFYTGDDPKLWAENRVALLRYVNVDLRNNLPGTQMLIDANEHEASMLLALIALSK
jgi:hypothetical protein